MFNEGEYTLTNIFGRGERARALVSRSGNGNNAARARTEFNPVALNLYVVEGFNKVLVNLISGKFIHLALTNARAPMLKIKLIIRPSILAGCTCAATRKRLFQRLSHRLFIYAPRYTTMEERRATLESDTTFHACPRKNNQPVRAQARQTFY
jgi:hypothetical protein